MSTYGGTSFMAQCPFLCAWPLATGSLIAVPCIGRKAFGIGKGDELWAAVNKVFDQMPVAAVSIFFFCSAIHFAALTARSCAVQLIGGKIFCVHGGVPREVVRNPGKGVLRDIQTIPKGCAAPDNILFLSGCSASYV